MTNVQIRGLMAAHRANRRSFTEQQRELDHLRYRSYRGIPTQNTSWVTEDLHGTFTYRGVSYTK
jgi:hypothetical protein